MTEQKHTAEVVKELTQSLLESSTFEMSDETGALNAPFVVELSKDRRLESTKRFRDELLTFPERRKGTVRLTSVDSFIEIVERFKNPDSVIFADTSQECPRLLAVFDYHPRGGVGGVEPSKVPSLPPAAEQLSAAALAKVGTGEPANPPIVWPPQLPLKDSARHAEHRALYEFPKSDEWIRWTALDGKWQSQEEFASFIRDNVMCVGMPEKAMKTANEIADKLEIKFCSAQRLMTLSKGLKVTANIDHEEKVNLQTGEATLFFKEEHVETETGQKLDIPGGFLINIPIFTGSDPWQLTALLEYKRNTNKRLSWRYSLYRFDHAFEAAVKHEAQRVKNATGLAVLLGKPGGKDSSEA
jgi:hypothetical protein